MPAARKDLPPIIHSTNTRALQAEDSYLQDNNKPGIKASLMLSIRCHINELSLLINSVWRCKGIPKTKCSAKKIWKNPYWLPQRSSWNYWRRAFKSKKKGHFQDLELKILIYLNQHINYYFSLSWNISKIHELMKNLQLQQSCYLQHVHTNNNLEGCTAGSITLMLDVCVRCGISLSTFVSSPK